MGMRSYPALSAANRAGGRLRRMNLQRAAIAISIGRVALGLGLIAAPERIGRSWIGPAATERSVEVLARAVGIRDIVLGAGAAAALLADGGSSRSWLLAQAGADAGDLVATVLAREVLPSVGVRATSALAGGSAAVTALAATRA